VLVITGKGASPYARHTLHTRQVFHTPEREGRLRREVTQWFHEALFRTHVIGYQPAHPRHGGGGAFYVKLRRTAHS
jgi:DNA-nicking Smr family endonuclease